MYEVSPFIYVQQQLSELRYDFQKLRGYEQDKIKFMTKVEVNETKCEGIRSRIKIAKEPIFSKNDVITFLLIFEWFPNSSKTNNKVRKGSFATQKEFASLRVRYTKNTVEQQQLVNIVFLLSEKIYIQDRFIDDFVNVISKRGEIHFKQLNCLTILLIGSDGKQRMGNLASTMADTNKYQLYQFENMSMYNSMAEPQKMLNNNNNDYLLNRFTTLLHRTSNSSRFYERSARLSVGSRDNLEDSFSKSETRFNLNRAKKYFSAVEYLTSSSQVNIQMIIYHLGEDRNPIDGGLRADVVQEVITQWPKFNNYSRIYKLNKERLMEDLLEQAIQNYRLMISMELEEIEVVKLDEIYITINEFSDKILEEFMAAAREYINESDYDSYVMRLEKEMGQLQNELISNYAITKYEYGSRVIKNLEKKNYKNGIENYLLMKILGKQELNELDIGYRMYKQLMQSKLQQGFKQFLANKYKGRSYGRNSGNYYEDELNNVENRIQIYQAKKKLLDSAIQLGEKEAESLQLMLKLLENTQRGDSAKSQLLIE